MLKQGCFILFLGVIVATLSGCLGSLWTGASLVYDRHRVNKQLQDYHLAIEATNILYKDGYLKSPGCVTDLAVFNGDLLLVGHVPSAEFLEESKSRLARIKGYRRLFNELIIDKSPAYTAQDGWITSKIRAGIFADDSIDPKAFKVVTADGIVYLMGDVQRSQAEKVINIARHTVGVRRVVKAMKYYRFESQIK